MIKILLAFGTRPEAIKMAPIALGLMSSPEFRCILVVTGQHRKMLDQVLEIFGLTPDHDLAVMKQGQNLFDITASVLLGMKDVISSENPDFVLVHGDTATTFAASLAAFYSKVPVCHVEAGLRTNDLKSPWPEEANRQLTSRIATWHFAPTEENRRALLLENVSSDRITVTGNTVIDALHWVINRIDSDAQLESLIMSDLGSAGLKKIPSYGEFVLITGHRRENFGQGFKDICDAIAELAENHPSTRFIFPVHLNPAVRVTVNEMLGKKPNVNLIEPVGYKAFVWLMQQSKLILTDSGGVQEEAPSLNKPVLVMRETTERAEAVNAGLVELVGTSKEVIVRRVTHLLSSTATPKGVYNNANPYGDGNAVDRIIKKLSEIASSNSKSMAR